MKITAGTRIIGVPVDVSRGVLSSRQKPTNRNSERPEPIMRALFIAALVTAAACQPGDVEARRLSRDYSSGYVTAESRFGNGSVSGPVRPARYGWEVRLPGGTWVGCRRSCSETLRVETVDFWEGNVAAGQGAIAHECGIFGCLELRWPR